jgi:hypothetical protein
MTNTWAAQVMICDSYDTLVANKSIMGLYTQPYSAVLVRCDADDLQISK